MDSNEILVKIKALYKECQDLESKILANRTRINEYMQKFIVGYQIGSDVYSDNATRGYDIDLSGSKEDYEEAMTLINSDIDDIDLLISKHNQIKELIPQVPQTEEILEIGTNSIEMIQKMYKEREERIEVLNKLKQIYTLLKQQEEEIKNNNHDSNTSSSDGYNPGNSNSTGSPSGNQKSNQTNNNNQNNNQTQTNNDTSFDPESYKATMSFNITNDDMNVTKSNLASHAENVKGILSHVSVNGEIIGGDVYGITNSSTDSDVSFNFGALQLACDAVKADVAAIGNYITQMRNKITSNNAKIAATKAEMDRTETVTGVDANGNEYSYERKVHSGAEIAAYQAEIDAMEAENTQLEADITAYTEEKTQKEEVFKQLVNLRNTYNNVYGGLMDTFAANDLINGMTQDGTLLGMSLTDQQKTELFNNLGANLLNSQGNLSLVTSDDFSLMAGEYPLGAFQYLVGACSILGNANNNFGDNLNMFHEYQQAIASTLEYNDETSSTDSKINANSKNSTTINGEGIVGSNTQLGPTGRPLTATQLNSVVEQFMINNKGNMVEISDEMKSALGLQLDALISIPKAYTTSEDWPFTVWLAGTGTAGGDTQNLKSSVFIKHIVDGSYTVDNTILYVPVGWGTGTSAGSDSKYSASALNHDLRIMVDNLNVDDNHVSGMGISIGAFALANLVDSNPNMFSSVAMCGGGFGGPWGNVTIENAIQNSPGTSFIWYNANNDETSRNSKGEGVNTYCQQQHQQLIDAGMNSVYYEVGGDIWHTYACEYFVTPAMINDLVSIERGQKYTVSSTIQKISATAAHDASLAGGAGTNNWYKPISRGNNLGVTPGYTKTGTTQQANTVEEKLPNIYTNIKGDIPDISHIEKVNQILDNVPVPTGVNIETPLVTLAYPTRSVYGLDPLYIKDGFVVYSQLGSMNEDGTINWEGWDKIYKQNSDSGVYSAKWLKNIKQSGCSVASSAMVVSNLTNQNITPDVVKTLYHSYDANLGYSFAKDVFGTYNLDYTSGMSINWKNNNGEYYYDNVLRNGGAIIQTVNEGTHYIAILGIDDSGNTKRYFVADPNTQSPGQWLDADSREFMSIRNGHSESSMAIAPQGMDINQALADPGSTSYDTLVIDHHYNSYM